MPLMERVREIGSEEARVDDGSICIARQSLAREMARGSRPDAVRRSRRRWAGIGIGGLVAGTAVTAIVVGSVLAPVDTPSAAAAVFERAAAGATETAEAALAPGQFRRFETTFSSVVNWDEDMPAGAHFNNSAPMDAEAALLVEDTMITYVPAVAADDWVRERIPYAVVGGRGDRVDEARMEWAASNSHPGLAGITRYPGGAAEAGGAEGTTFEYYLDSRDVYADLPDDAGGVVDWFSARYEGEGDTYGLGHYFVETISDLNVFNLATATTRASLLRAFATLGDVEVVGSEGDTTTLRYEGRNDEGEIAPIEFTLDTTGGYVLGITSWPYGVDGSGADETGEGTDGAPAWQSRSQVVITVVDSAP